MAVTAPTDDPIDSLPYWARQGGAGAAPGPGATGGPAAAPQGAGGQPGGADSASWLQYLAQMFGISPAQAAQLSQNGLPPGAASALNSGGSPVPSALSGGGPPVPPSVGGAPPMRPPNTAGMQPGALSSGALGAFNNMPPPTGGGGPNPNAPAPAAQPVSMAPSAANPLAGAGGATAMGASSNPRFVGVPQPNASAQNSMRGGPQATALNLAGMFGGGGAPGGAPGAPGGVPGPMANAPTPPVMPPDVYKRRKMLPNY
jgi:translation initiation factor IF-2